MSLPVLNIAVISSCDGCGAQCCQHMVMPPFVIFSEADEEWDELTKNHPALAAALLAEYERKKWFDDWPEEAPCFWLDQSTGKCKHYDQRPDICRDFDRGSPECLEFRKNIYSDLPLFAREGER